MKKKKNRPGLGNNNFDIPLFFSTRIDDER